jgi:hypothetical protein
MQNRSIRNVPFYPYTQGGQAIAYTGAAEGLSAAMDVGREHNVWLTEDAWVRVGTGAVANDFPLAAGAIYVYTPTIAGVDDQLAFIAIDPLAVGSVAYIGRSER